MSPYGNHQSVQWQGAFKAELLQVLEEMHLRLSLGVRYYQYTGLYLSGKRFTSEQVYVLIHDKCEHWQMGMTFNITEGESLGEYCFVACIGMVIKVPAIATERIIWARVMLLKPLHSIDKMLQVPLYCESVATWVPLYMPAQLWIASVEQVLPHPQDSQSDKGVLCRNTWVRRTFCVGD